MGWKCTYCVSLSHFCIFYPGFFSTWVNPFLRNSQVQICYKIWLYFVVSCFEKITGGERGSVYYNFVTPNIRISLHRIFLISDLREIYFIQLVITFTIYLDIKFYAPRYNKYTKYWECKFVFLTCATRRPHSHMYIIKHILNIYLINGEISSQITWLST